jgi:hypothetical protein
MGSTSLRGRGAERRRREAQDTADAPATRRAFSRRAVPVILAVYGLLAPGCATKPSAPTPSRGQAAQHIAALEEVLARTAEPPRPGSVRIRLAFGAGADLDLFVTDGDPRSHETVYFAKHRTRSGGRLLRDARCDDAAPRTDIVVFDAVPRGGLRIGVDHHAPCADPAASEPFVVEIATAERRETRSGVARPGHFDDGFWRWEPGDQYMPNVK